VLRKTRYINKSKKREIEIQIQETALSHLVFSAFEKPMIILVLLGSNTYCWILIGIYIAYLRFSGDLNSGRPLLTFALLLILGGIQILSFGIYRYPDWFP